jgi:D-glycero-alpha-D-manno-heptose-7-phosphate kinase
MNIDNFIVSEKKSLREALEKINNNNSGTVFIVNKDKIVVGVATDGDIRRKLLSGSELDDGLDGIYNKNFVSCLIDTPREILIKKLDSEVAVIPILDTKGKLNSIASRNNYPIMREEDVYAQSRAPVRISFGGGGSDLTHYFDKENGAVINSAISVYSHAILKKRSDNKIIIKSDDLNDSLFCDNLNELLNKEGSFWAYSVSN